MIYYTADQMTAKISKFIYYEKVNKENKSI